MLYHQLSLWLSKTCILKFLTSWSSRVSGINTCISQKLIWLVLSPSIKFLYEFWNCNLSEFWIRSFCFVYSSFFLRVHPFLSVVLHLLLPEYLESSLEKVLWWISGANYFISILRRSHIQSRGSWHKAESLLSLDLGLPMNPRPWTEDW